MRDEEIKNKLSLLQDMLISFILREREDTNKKINYLAEQLNIEIPKDL